MNGKKRRSLYAFWSYDIRQSTILLFTVRMSVPEYDRTYFVSVLNKWHMIPILNKSHCTGDPVSYHMKTVSLNRYQSPGRMDFSSISSIKRYQRWIVFSRKK